MESIPHGNLQVALRTTTKTTTNKTKTITNDCSGIMGKPSCSAVQLGRKDKPWTVWPEPLLSISACFYKYSENKQRQYLWLVVYCQVKFLPTINNIIFYLRLKFP
jgi:hypothetical protein